jgi:hypothetical protein
MILIAGYLFPRSLGACEEMTLKQYASSNCPSHSPYLCNTISLIYIDNGGELVKTQAT